MDESKIRRYHFLFDRGNDVFNRLAANIDSLKSRCATFIGIVLGITSIMIGILLSLLQNGWSPACFSKCILIGYFLLNTVVLVMNFYILKPDRYKELNIFERDRFDELLKMEEERLYSDFLYNIKDAYEFNKNKHAARVKLFKRSLYLFVLSTIVFVIGNIYG